MRTMLVGIIHSARAGSATGVTTNEATAKATDSHPIHTGSTRKRIATRAVARRNTTTPMAVNPRLRSGR
jgi:hypothetical protein